MRSGLYLDLHQDVDFFCTGGMLPVARLSEDGPENRSFYQVVEFSACVSGFFYGISIGPASTPPLSLPEPGTGDARPLMPREIIQPWFRQYGLDSVHGVFQDIGRLGIVVTD